MYALNILNFEIYGHSKFNIYSLNAVNCFLRLVVDLFIFIDHAHILVLLLKHVFFIY